MKRVWTLVAVAIIVLLVCVFLTLVIQARRVVRPPEQMPYVAVAADGVYAMEELLLSERNIAASEPTMSDVQKCLRHVVGHLPDVEVYIHPNWITTITSADDRESVVLALRYQDEGEARVVTMTGAHQKNVGYTIPEDLVLVYESERQAGEFGAY